MATKKVLAVVEDLFFTVKINEAAKRAGLSVAFVKSERDALDQAAGLPALIILDLNFAGVEPVELIRKLKADPALQKISLLGYVSADHLLGRWVNRHLSGNKYKAIGLDGLGIRSDGFRAVVGGDYFTHGASKCLAVRLGRITENQFMKAEA
jgi:CheY-like chemotaxis protein